MDLILQYVRTCMRAYTFYIKIMNLLKFLLQGYENDVNGDTIKNDYVSLLHTIINKKKAK